jgi:hypothetical protein
MTRRFCGELRHERADTPTTIITRSFRDARRSPDHVNAQTGERGRKREMRASRSHASADRTLRLAQISQATACTLPLASHATSSSGPAAVVDAVGLDEAPIGAEADRVHLTRWNHRDTSAVPGPPHGSHERGQVLKRAPDVQTRSHERAVGAEGRVRDHQPRAGTSALPPICAPEPAPVCVAATQEDQDSDGEVRQHGNRTGSVAGVRLRP